MATLKYVGRNPDSDNSVAHKQYTDTSYNQVKVDTTYVDSRLATVTSQLATKAYVDDQDNTRAKKSAVDTADNNYVLISSVGQANGVAGLDSNSYIPSANLDFTGVQTERKPFFKNVDTISLSGSTTVTSVGERILQIATLTITDPGFPYIPLPFALVQGGATAAPQTPTRSFGTPNYAQIGVWGSNNTTKYGYCICTPRKVLDFHTVLPWGDDTISPATRTPVQGNLTLNLWVGLRSPSGGGSTTYTFTSTGLQFYVMCYPGME